RLYVRGMGVLATGNLLPFTWQQDLDGKVRPFIGNRPGGSRFPFPDGSAIASLDVTAQDLVALPDGLAVSMHGDRNYIYKVTNALPGLGLGLGEFDIPSERGPEIYHFDSRGRQVRTLHAHTYETHYTFTYEENGRLSAIQDAQGL